MHNSGWSDPSQDPPLRQGQGSCRSCGYLIRWMSMLFGLFFLFTLVPLVELYLLIRLGTYIGAVDTIAIVIGTGVAGGLLAKSQGLAVFDRMRAELNQGRLPAESLFDGLLILIAGAMLITPGLLTDGLGLLFLVPWSRQAFKSWLKRKIQEKISEGEIHISTHLR